MNYLLFRFGVVVVVVVDVNGRMAENGEPVVE